MFKDYREQWALDTDFSTYTRLTPTIPGELFSADEVSDVVSKKKEADLQVTSLKANSEPQSLWKWVQSLLKIILYNINIFSANICCFIKEF